MQDRIEKGSDILVTACANCPFAVRGDYDHYCANPQRDNSFRVETRRWLCKNNPINEHCPATPDQSPFIISFRTLKK